MLPVHGVQLDSTSQPPTRLQTVPWLRCPPFGEICRAGGHGTLWHAIAPGRTRAESEPSKRPTSVHTGALVTVVAHWVHRPRPIRKGPLSSHRARAPAFRYCQWRCCVRHARRVRGRIYLRRSEQQALLVTNPARREGGASWTRAAVWRRSMVNWARKPTSAQCWVLGAFPSVAFKSQSSTSSVLRRLG